MSLTWSLVMMPPIIVVCQLSLEAISAPVPSCSSNVGSANALGMLYGGGMSSGPMARTITLFASVPWMMNPPIITLSPVCTKQRVLMLPNCDAGMGGVLVAAVIARVLVSATRQTTINNGRRSFFMLGSVERSRKATSQRRYGLRTNQLDRKSFETQIT